MANRACNLECVKDNKGDNVKEFVGPVKIILIDVPRSAYIRKTWYAALLLLAQMLMSFTTLTVIFYSISYPKKDVFIALHIFLCTVGFQLCIPSGILSLNNLNGSAFPMKMKDRKFEHLFIQTFGLLCATAGTGISLYSNSSFTIHSCLGIASNCLLLLSGVTGLYEYMTVFSGDTLDYENLGGTNRFVYCIHKILGILGFLTSSANFIYGVIKIPFKKWLPLDEMFYATIAFCIFYSIVIAYKPIKELF